MTCDEFPLPLPDGDSVDDFIRFKVQYYRYQYFCGLWHGVSGACVCHDAAGQHPSLGDDLSDIVFAVGSTTPSALAVVSEGHSTGRLLLDTVCMAGQGSVVTGGVIPAVSSFSVPGGGQGIFADCPFLSGDLSNIVDGIEFYSTSISSAVIGSDHQPGRCQFGKVSLAGQESVMTGGMIPAVILFPATVVWQSLLRKGLIPGINSFVESLSFASAWVLAFWDLGSIGSQGYPNWRKPKQSWLDMAAFGLDLAMNLLIRPNSSFVCSQSRKLTQCCSEWFFKNPHRF